MNNKMNIAEWARLNEMTPEEFKHEMVLTMAGIGSIDLDKLNDDNDVSYRCGFGKFAYQVIVRKL
jgi:hypothetical protein